MTEPIEERQFIAQTKAGSIDEKNASLIAFASTDAIDRDGEVILPSAFEKSLLSFRKNPVVLWAHDHSRLPIGRSLAENIIDTGLQFNPQFAIKESLFAKEVFELYKSGFLNAFSVGFVPKEFTKDEAEGKEVKVFTEVELLEVSAVPVPSNSGALVLRSHGGVSMENVKQLTTEKIMEVLIDFQKQEAQERALIMTAAKQTIYNMVQFMNLIKETLRREYKL